MLVEMGEQLKATLTANAALQQDHASLTTEVERLRGADTELQLVQAECDRLAAAVAQSIVDEGAGAATGGGAALEALRREHDALKRERDAMAEELAALTPEFFEEVEDLALPPRPGGGAAPTVRRALRPAVASSQPCQPPFERILYVPEPRTPTTLSLSTDCISLITARPRREGTRSLLARRDGGDQGDGVVEGVARHGPRPLDRLRRRGPRAPSPPPPSRSPARSSPGTPGGRTGRRAPSGPWPPSSSPPGCPRGAAAPPWRVRRRGGRGGCRRRRGRWRARAAAPTGAGGGAAPRATATAATPASEVTRATPPPPPRPPWCRWSLAGCRRRRLDSQNGGGGGVGGGGGLSEEVRHVDVALGGGSRGP